MLYDIHVFDKNITGINIHYKDTKVLYIIDTCNVHLFQSSKYSWKHKTSGENTEPILYYQIKEGNKVKHIQYKRFITHATDIQWVSTINGNYYDLRTKNLITHPMGRNSIKENKIKENKSKLFPFNLDFDQLKYQIENKVSLEKIILNNEYRISFDPLNNFGVITNIENNKSLFLNGDIDEQTKEDFINIFNPLNFAGKENLSK